MLEAVDRHLRRAAVRRHRTVLVLTGQHEALVVRAQRLITGLRQTQVCWFSDRPPAGACAVSGGDALSLLGTELDALVFDAWAGFDPDAFGVLTGCIRAGGLLILLSPPLADWPSYPDPQHARITVAPVPAAQVSGRFLARLATLLDNEPALFLAEDERLVRQPPPTAAQAPVHAAIDFPTDGCKTGDQQRAVEALIKVVTGHRRRPVVLVSDRGRGKSAAFGIAAARLAATGRQRILLTAPSAAAVAAVYERAEQLEPGARGYLHFKAPDELVATLPAADLVLVDEAAAIPLPMLEKLLRHYARIAFASTVHGYEGTGRGFTLRFSTLLEALSNSWTTLRLSTPIRWAVDDPLEQLVFRLLALDAEPADSRAFGVAAAAQDFELCCLQRDALAADEQMLSELFGLLVQAHYRTRPLDLRHLLDGPNLSVYVLRAGGHIAATALVAAEGGFEPEVAQAIYAGKSRPQGHLLPESLAVHQGLQQAPLLRCGRIMRLAVHPALQRRGLGSQLLCGVAARLAAEGYDYAGSSFGATAQLLDFWRGLDWFPVRLSINKGTASGTHSAVCLQAFTAAGEALLAEARGRFFAQFPHQLVDRLGSLEATLVAGLLRHGDAFAAPLDAADERDLRAFVYGERLVEVTIGSLWRLALRALMQGRAAALSDAELTVLVKRVLQRHSWASCASAGGFSGRKQALRCLRTAVGKLLD